MRRRAPAGDDDPGRRRRGGIRDPLASEVDVRHGPLEAEGLWEEAVRGSDGGGGRGRRWRCATRRAPALANRISGGCHYVVPASSKGEEEDGAKSGGGPTKEQDSNDDDDGNDDDGMVVARA